MAHTKLVIGSYTIEFHGEKKYSVKWDLKLEKAGIFPKPNRERVVAAAAHNFEEIQFAGSIIASELTGRTADKYIFDTILPALGLIRTQTVGTLTLELNGGQLVATGWVTNMIIDRTAEAGIEMLDVSFTFVLDQPPTHTGLT